MVVFAAWILRRYIWRPFEGSLWVSEGVGARSDLGINHEGGEVGTGAGPPSANLAAKDSVRKTN